MGVINDPNLAGMGEPFTVMAVILAILIYIIITMIVKKYDKSKVKLQGIVLVMSVAVVIIGVAVIPITATIVAISIIFQIIFIVVTAVMNKMKILSIKK